MAYQINLTGKEIDERLQNIGTAEDVAAADGTLYARISKNADDVDELRDTVGHIDSAQTATNKTVTQHTADISTLQTALKTKANLANGKVSVTELPVVTSLGNPNNGTIPTTFAVSKAINDKIVGLLNWQGVKDTTDEIKDIALAKKGDVWHSNEDGSEWVCTEDIFTADHSVWEELGTPIDLSGYYTKNEVDKKVRIEALDNGDASASFVAGRNLKVNGWEFYWKDVWEESEPSAIKHIESAGVNAAINEIKGTGADVSAFTFPTTKDEFIAYLKTITFDFSNKPNQVSGYGSITYGIMNKNAGTTTIVEGMYNDISNKMHRSHIEGQHMTIPDVEYAVSCHVEGQDCDIVGYASICHLEGNNSAVVHSMGKNVGFFDEAVGCHVEGGGGVVGGAYSHVEGDGCAALNAGAHCEGKGYYKNSVTDWKKRTAKDNDYLKDLWKKILFGKTDTSGYTYKFSAAIGNASHVEGIGNIAPKASVTLEGLDTGATASFVNGANHAEGAGNFAGAAASHAEGIRNEIGHNAYASHAEGIKNTTQNRAEHASGQYNKSNKATDTFGDAGNTLFSVGCGTSDADRKNAFEVMQDGTCKYLDVATGEQIDVGVAKELSKPFDLTIGSTTKKVDGKSVVAFTAEEIWRKDSSLRDLYISAGAVYNEATGYYELNGLTDITEEQMSVIWQEDLSGWYLKGRTNLTRNIEARGNAGGYNGGIDICNMCSGNQNITVFNFFNPPFIRQMDNAFSNCIKLKTIDTRFPIYPYGGIVGPNTFRGCTSLEEVRFNMLHLKSSTNVNFPASSLISKTSILSIIETTPTTGSVKPLVVVGLNESAYNRLKDDTDIQQALTEKNGFVTLTQI